MLIQTLTIMESMPAKIKKIFNSEGIDYYEHFNVNDQIIRKLLRKPVNWMRSVML